MDFLWSKPDLTQDKIFVVSDGSEKDGIGGMATLIADPVLQKVFVFACQVSPGPGKVTSYRAETYGLACCCGSFSFASSTFAFTCCSSG
mmetsp:Transcript_10917/g.15094  ORF Transcript_10917/g.15094 Transcript_10917/m.15094 type:complete len:89 (-) Transcript_10917:290-556(-)